MVVRRNRPPNERHVLAGRIGGSYGIKGWVRIHSFTSPKENLLRYKHLFLRSNCSLESLVLDEGRVHGKGLVAHIDGVDNRERADQFRGKEILIDLATLPDLEEGQYYWHELIGLRVSHIDPTGIMLLGRVNSLLETGANDVLVVSPCEGSIDLVERLIPYKLDDVVTKIDLSSGDIEVNWFVEG